ncbi:hypothetical protein GOODEAATRI_011444, partial [Goodea atripinnis]
ARQNQMQQMQKELQQAKETLQQNLAKQKELQQTNQATQQSHNQELSESKNKEEQLKQQMAEKEEKTKKAILGAKLKISQVNSAKEQLSQENEELKQSKEELEVRMNALKSQYEGRLLRLDRELRELRETQAHSDGREEALDQSGAKMEGDEELDGELRDVGDQQVSPDDSQELPEGFQVLAVDMDEEDEGVSQSVPSDQGSQGLAFIRDVIVIDTDSESRESKDWDQRVEEEEEEEEEEEDEEEEAAGEQEKAHVEGQIWELLKTPYTTPQPAPLHTPPPHPP